MSMNLIIGFVGVLTVIAFVIFIWLAYLMGETTELHDRRDIDKEDDPYEQQ